MRPSLPRYTCTWDIQIVLDHFKTLDLPTLSLKMLSKKLVLLLLLLTGQRLQTLQVIKRSNVHFTNEGCAIYIDSLLKTSRPSFHTSHIKFDFYEIHNLCVARHLQRYMAVTKDLCGQCDHLLISHVKPHKPISTDTISRWTKDLLSQCGIDIKTFSSHSTRSAATSKGLPVGIPLDNIMLAGSWSNIVVLLLNFIINLYLQ